MSVRVSAVRNDYRCSIERNQAGKYCVRIRVEESLDFLQRHEEKLWFWGVDRAEDMGFSAEFLREAGLRLDRRIEFPPKGANLALAPERSVPAFVLGPVRRGLAESMESPRPLLSGD